MTPDVLVLTATLVGGRASTTASDGGAYFPKGYCIRLSRPAIDMAIPVNRHKKAAKLSGADDRLFVQCGQYAIAQADLSICGNIDERVTVYTQPGQLT